MPTWRSFSLIKCPEPPLESLIHHVRSRTDPSDNHCPDIFNPTVTCSPGRFLSTPPASLDGQSDQDRDIHSSPSSSEDIFTSAQSFQRGPPSPPQTPPNDEVQFDQGKLTSTSIPLPPLTDSSSPDKRENVARRSFSARFTAVKKRTSYPDRFIPNRLPSTASERPIYVTKHPSLLRPDERITRRRGYYNNPFNPRTRRERGQLATQTLLDSTQYGFQPPTLITEPFVLGSPPNPFHSPERRSISVGGVWNIGGPITPSSGPITAIPNGRGGSLGSGTNAPIYNAGFLEDMPGLNSQSDAHEDRIALALDIDQASRILPFSGPSPQNSQTRSFSGTKRPASSPVCWKDTAWAIDRRPGPRKKSRKETPVPITPFRVLDAPNLRDDFYCSPLAYSPTTGILAVALLNQVYLWSENNGVQNPPLDSVNTANYVTSVSFSSAKGGQSILAVGRQGGRVSLWSAFDQDVRFDLSHPHAVACVSFKHVPTRASSQRVPGIMVDTEELLVGDELGEVYYYSIEWTDHKAFSLHGWRGAVTLLARIRVHVQQICGLAWSPDGAYFASGSNDNQCCLFDTNEVLRHRNAPNIAQPVQGVAGPSCSTGSSVPRQSKTFPLQSLFSRHRSSHRSFSDSFTPVSAGSSAMTSNGIFEPLNSARRIIIPPSGVETSAAVATITTSKHRWHHRAAVKALAFCPWQRGLIATGGGSNDRCIHFYHTFSGAKLATINVAAQITSLIWSATRREIAATFGYAQPDHPYRIAVFAWPSCEQVVAIPWNSSVGNGGDMRALYAIAYPGGPNESKRGDGPNNNGCNGFGSWEREGSGWWGRTRQEGCIVVAGSDESVKFHEIWSGRGGAFGVGVGVRGGLGGSDILEGLEGADMDREEVIR